MCSLGPSQSEIRPWTLVTELGIDYADATQPERPRLTAPVVATRGADGSYLIVDEICAEKPIPFRLEYRSICLDAQGAVLFDSRDMGLADAYGCWVDGDTIALLRRTQWALELVNRVGDITTRIDLTTFSKCLPRIVVATDEDSFLAVFLDRSSRLDIVEFDRSGRLRWFLPRSVDFLGVPTSIQKLAGGTFLIADAFRHVIWEIDRKGQPVWRFGQAGEPARALNRVAGACCAREIADGRRLIVDTRNHRLLWVAPDGSSSVQMLEDGSLCDPMYAEVTGDGNLLVCDTGNARVVEFDALGHTVWQYGMPTRRRRMLCFPRSVEVTPSGEYWIADTANDRIVRANRQGGMQTISEPSGGLFWPRCGRPLPAGFCLIGDGRHGRVLELSPNGEIRRQVSDLKGARFPRLQDPHDVRCLPNGHLLIADSPSDAILEIDWSGQVYRQLGGPHSIELDDPHAALALADGTWVVCDTGNHRILFVDSRGECFRCLEHLREGESIRRLNFPKYLDVSVDGTLLIVDTGNHRVLAATATGQLIWEVSRIPESPIPGLNQPRWATLVNPDEVVISDHFHHRVVHLRRPGPAP